MKLIQLNIWCGRLERQAQDMFAQYKPDIVCLQEALSYPKQDAAFFYTAENIQAQHDLKYLSFAPVMSFQLMNDRAEFGNCIASRHPIARSETVFTNLEYQERFDFEEHDYNIRNFLHCQLQLPGGKSCHIITHHGHHVREHKNGNEETLRQMEQLAAYVAALEGPVIVTGDFNLAPHSPSLEKLNGILTNLPVKHRLKTTRNHLTHKTEVCDYIFVNDQVEVTSFKVADEVVSDHQALVLEFNV